MDWESVLLAPPERDLWEPAEADPGLLDAYSAATGTAIDTDALADRGNIIRIQDVACVVESAAHHHAVEPEHRRERGSARPQRQA